MSHRFQQGVGSFYRVNILDLSEEIVFGSYFYFIVLGKKILCDQRNFYIHEIVVFGSGLDRAGGHG